MLSRLHASPFVSLRIHSTRISPSSTSNSTLSLREGKKSSASEDIFTSRVSEDVDIEKDNASSSSSLYSALTIYQGRPNIAAIITEIVSNADRGDRIAITACGPDSMIQMTRKSVAKSIRVDGPSLELHCEQFGW